MSDSDFFYVIDTRAPGTVESKTRLTLGRFGFINSPLTLPHVLDVLCIDTRSPLSHPLALNSDLTPVSARHLSRWLFLLVHHSAGARPIRPPAVYHPMTVMGADIFVHCLDETETFPYDSPNPLPPGCYVLFDLNNNPYPYLVGRTMPRPTSTKTQPTWNVPDDDSRASYRMTNPVPEPLASQARERDRGLCCFAGRPSDCITWVIPPLLSGAVTPLPFSLECCLSPDNVFTISSDLLKAYHDNRITVDPQTLAVRLAGCDVRFDGVSAIQARELLDELTWDGNHTVPQSSEWSTSTEQEAIRTFFWARAGAPASRQEWEERERTPPLSPSHFISSSSDGVDPVSDNTASRQNSARTNFFWLLFERWWIFIY
ncbi:hypothetical protein B0H14DRAFT_3700086 [Mycena olivaceomarginata]|nr:hypothetical protein B0H14DRAFT_3700086 [Mycena olivaceomarginata]